MRVIFIFLLMGGESRVLSGPNSIEETHKCDNKAPIYYRQGALRILNEDLKKNEYEPDVVYIWDANDHGKNEWIKAFDQGLWYNSFKTWQKLYECRDGETAEQRLKKNLRIAERLENFLKTENVPQDDERILLRGQRTVYAQKRIKENTIIGLYAGGICERGEKKLSCDETVELNLEYVHNQKTRYSNAIELDRNKYAIGLGDNLSLTGYARSNVLSLINCAYGPGSERQGDEKNNVTYMAFRLGGNFPVVGVVARKEIKKGEEVLADYGLEYWNNLSDFYKKCDCKRHSFFQKRGAENVFTFEGVAKKGYTLLPYSPLKKMERRGIYVNAQGVCATLTDIQAKQINSGCAVNIDESLKTKKTSKSFEERFFPREFIKRMLTVDEKGNFVMSRHGNFILYRGRKFEEWKGNPEHLFFKNSEKSVLFKGSIKDMTAQKDKFISLDRYKKHDNAVTLEGKNLSKKDSSFKRQWKGQPVITKNKFNEKLFKDSEGHSVNVIRTEKHSLPLLPSKAFGEQIVHPDTGQPMVREAPDTQKTEGITRRSFLQKTRLFDPVTQKRMLTYQKAKELVKKGNFSIEAYKKSYEEKTGRKLCSLYKNLEKKFVHHDTGQRMTKEEAKAQRVILITEESFYGRARLCDSVTKQRVLMYQEIKELVKKGNFSLSAYEKNYKEKTGRTLLPSYQLKQKKKPTNMFSKTFVGTLVHCDTGQPIKKDAPDIQKAQGIKKKSFFNKITLVHPFTGEKVLTREKVEKLIKKGNFSLKAFREEYEKDGITLVTLNHFNSKKRGNKSLKKKSSHLDAGYLKTHKEASAGEGVMQLTKGDPADLTDMPILTRENEEIASCGSAMHIARNLELVMPTLSRETF